jgi:hypothetical protein
MSAASIALHSPPKRLSLHKISSASSEKED